MKNIMLISAVIMSVYTGNALAKETVENVTSQEVQTEAITQAAESFILNQFEDSSDRIEVSAHRIDPRAPTRFCDTPLHVELANNQNLERQATVQVSCADNVNNWRLYVPVRIARMQTILVAKRSLGNGQVINANDFELAEVDATRIRGSVFTSSEGVEGARIKRRIQVGDPLQSRDLCFVCRGEQVTIISSIGNLRVEATGTAQHDAVLGESISVINSRSDKSVQGRVSGTGRVTVN